MGKQLKVPPVWVLFAFLTVPVGLYIVVAIFPIVLSFIYSMLSNGADQKFIGFRNYLRILEDLTFRKALWNNVVITLLSVIGQVGGGFLVAVILHQRTIRFKSIHRTVIFFPVVMSTVVIGLIWMMIYNSDGGLLNSLLRFLGMESYIQLWLDNPAVVLYSVSAPVIWQFIGLYMVIIMSSLEGIPRDVLESSEIDGAGKLVQTFRITIPMIYPTIKVAVMVCIAGTMKIFDHIFVMTGGGPGDASSVLALYAYKISFIRLNMSYGSAVSIAILLISLSIVVLSQLLMGGKKYE